MIETREFLLRARLDRAALDAWIEAGWLVPQHEAQFGGFSEIDIARARLIGDLKQTMGINDEGVDVILDLIDQIHGLRRTMRDLLSSIQAQPDETRRHIVAAVRTASSRRNGDESGSSEQPRSEPL